MIPVEPITLAAFVAAASVLVVSPGPDTLLILRYTMAAGPKAGVATLAGIQLGLVVHTAAAVVGLSLLIVSVPVLFRALAVAGALYLGWLGLQSLRAGSVSLQGHGRGPVSAAKACRDGMMTNLLNPKVILLFLALMPNFIDLAHGSAAAQLATLGATLIAVNTLWQGTLALGAEGARRLIGRPAVQRTLARASGVALLAVAAVMLAQHAV